MYSVGSVCVPLRWSGSRSMNQDQSDHGTSKETINSFSEWIYRFLWYTLILDPDLPKCTHPKQKAKPSLCRLQSVSVGREFTELPRNNLVSTGTGKINNEKVDWILTLFWSASFVKETAFKLTSVLLPWNRIFIITVVLLLSCYLWVI